MSENLPALSTFDQILASLVPLDADLNQGVLFANPLEIRPKIVALEQAMTELPADVIRQVETTHRFADGLYIREVFIPKGLAVVGRIHKHSAPAFMCAGVKLTLTEEGMHRIIAPFSTISKPGVKRVGIALEDSVWTTVHPNPTNTRDIKQLEAEIFADSYDDVETATVDTSPIVTMEGFNPWQE